jgi:hypothetical protein
MGMAKNPECRTQNSEGFRSLAFMLNSDFCILNAIRCFSSGF